MIGLSVMQLPTRAGCRLMLRRLVVCLVPLVLLVVTWHRDRLDRGAAISWAFCAVAGGLALVALERRPGEDAPTGRGPAVLWRVTGASGLWGLVLLARAEGSVAALWLWPQDALSSRLIGAMLLTLALMGVEAARRVDLVGPIWWCWSGADWRRMGWRRWRPWRCTGWPGGRCPGPICRRWVHWGWPGWRWRWRSAPGEAGVLPLPRRGAWGSLPVSAR